MISTKIQNRLKDALWSIRRRYGLEADIDRIFSYVAFNRDLTAEQLEALFILHPTRVPEDFRSALLALIRQTIRRYWLYCLSKKGYHRVLERLQALENTVRYGPEAYDLIESEGIGFRLQLKSRFAR